MKRNTFWSLRLSQILLALLCVGSLSTFPRAQHATQTALGSNVSEDRVAFHQALLDLTNPWTVMCIAAHPDDEDGTSLIVMRRKYGAHTVSLFSTFGEGGQNAIGPELYEELGAIRARETMAAAEIQGSEPHFLGLKDFGYSKSADEAFRIWGHDEPLRRMVLQIRKLRPDVIITNHSATSNDHGHHQATARLELEAFDAAADPKRFPEQLKGRLTTWQVQRLFVRAPRNITQNAGQKPDREGGLDSIVTIDPNERDPVRGTTFAEEALRALQKHATQGPWPKTVAQMAARFANSSDGRLPLIRYRLVREAKSADALTKDLHNFLDGLRLPEEVARRLELLTANGRPLVESGEKPSLIFERLVKGMGDGMSSLSAVRSDYRLSALRGRSSRALALVAGLKLKVVPFMTVVTPDSHVDLTVTLSNAGTQFVRFIGCGSNIPSLGERTDSFNLKSLNYSAPKGVDRLASGAVFGTSNRVWFSHKIPVNIPVASHLYESSGQGVRVITSCSIEVANSRFNVEEETRIDVANALEIQAMSPSPIVKTPADTKTKLRGNRDCGFDVKVRLINRQFSPFSGELLTRPGFGRKASSRSITIPPLAKTDISLFVPGCSLWTDPNKEGERRPEPISFTLAPKGTTKTLARLDVPLVWADARVVPNLRVAYVRGFDYSLPNALAALGVESKELSVDEVKTADLQKYSTIIVDNRVYESQPELITANQRLLDYAKGGGTLIVFYHKSNEWNPDERRKRPQLAPYKLILGDERITDETAPITFIEPQHPLLNTPNKMGQEDFANWIQERGLYYPKDWDPQFHALLQSNDPGEASLKGGLLVADYGRGHYIYSSMVWYRQLRAGVPGAYRMLANMISYGKTSP